MSEAVALNLLTTEALQCIWPPRFERMPAVWLVDAAILLMSVLLLLSATKRDDDEIKMVEMIIVGRTIERRQRLARIVSLMQRPVDRTSTTEGGKRRGSSLAAISTSAVTAMAAIAKGRRGSAAEAPEAEAAATTEEEEEEEATRHGAPAGADGFCATSPSTLATSPPPSPPPPPPLSSLHRSSSDLEVLTLDDAKPEPAVPSSSDKPFASSMLPFPELGSGSDDVVLLQPDRAPSPAAAIPRVAVPDDDGYAHSTYVDGAAADEGAAPNQRPLSSSRRPPTLLERRSSSGQQSPGGRYTPGGTMLTRVGSGLSRAGSGLSRAGGGGIGATKAAFEGAISAIRRQVSRDRSGRYRELLASDHWNKARRFKNQIVLVRRWWHDVNRCHKRIWLSFKGTHTLLAGVVFRGAQGYTRAQTVQMLLSSMALELVVLCMFYSESSDGPMVINPVKIVVSGSVAAAICIPSLLIFGWLFDLLAFARLLRRLGWCLFCATPSMLIRSPFAAWRWCVERLCPRSSAARRYNRKRSFGVSASWVGADGSCGHSAASGRRGRSPPFGHTSKVSPEPCMSMAALAEAARLELEQDGGRGARGGGTARVGVCDGGGGAGGGTRGGGSAGGDGCKGAAAVVESVVERVIEEEEEERRLAAGSPRKRSSPLKAAAAASAAIASSSDVAGTGLRRPRPPPVALPSPSASTEAELEEVIRVVRTAERKYSYASLNEYQITLSLRRSLKRRDWRRACAIALGWALNWLLFLGLLLMFSTYGCHFYNVFGDPETAGGQQLLLSWLWSVGMRFLINEPFLICASKGLPMLFTSAFCANFCSESIVACLSLTVEGLVSIIKTLRTG